MGAASTQTFFFDISSHRDPGQRVTSEDELLSLLRAAVQAEPRVYELDGFQQGQLQLGLGGQYAVVHFIENADIPVSYDVRAQSPSALDYVEFLLGGTPTPIPPEYCVSSEEAVQAALFFFRTGERDPSLT